MNETDLYEYQKHAVNHILDKRYSGLFLEMGLGKTVITLTAIDKLMYEELEINRVLVIAPKRTAEEVWISEKEKWEHLNRLKMILVLGTEKERKKALNERADIYVINRENVAWLVNLQMSKFPFDMVVIDELSSFKSPKAIRFKMLKFVRPQLQRVVGLTGTPAPNSLIDLWAQMYLLDMGERLGKFVTGYREKYFLPNRRNGQVIFDYKLRGEGERQIHERISDICISMKTEDYLTLPERINRVVNVTLPPEVLRRYEQFEEEQILAIEGEEEDISAVNAAALSNKLLQFAGGAIYFDGGSEYYAVHRAKIEALKEHIESANGQPVLVFYNFRHEKDRILRETKEYQPVCIEDKGSIDAWNKGEIKVLLAHPASAGHGLNLQYGGHIIIWYGINWSLELYQQACARLHRMNQVKPVIVYHLVAVGTLDAEVMLSLEGKAKTQESLMQAIKARIKKYKK